VIADLSVHHVEGFALRAGYVVQRSFADYGYDLLMMTFDEDGYAESGQVYGQLKASGGLVFRTEGYAHDVDIRDYNLWMSEPMPVILALYDATARRAFWVHVQGYFATNLARAPKPGAQTVRIYASEKDVVNLRTIRRLRGLKQQAQDDAESR
jgi:hypothetical protein